jgi:hypothetical protein
MFDATLFGFRPAIARRCVRLPREHRGIVAAAGGPRRRRFVAWALLAIVLGGCDQGPWTAVVYSDRGDPTKFEVLGSYNSLGECRAAARARLGRSEASEARFDCGAKCTVDPEFPRLLRCEEMRR